MTRPPLPGAFLPVSDWEFTEAVKRANDAARLPHGERGTAYARIAADYGICTRTLQRWRGSRLHPVKVGRYRALFRVNAKGMPSQATAWERAA